MDQIKNLVFAEIDQLQKTPEEGEEDTITIKRRTLIWVNIYIKEKYKIRINETISKDNIYRKIKTGKHSSNTFQV